MHIKAHILDRVYIITLCQIIANKTIKEYIQLVIKKC